MIETLPPLVSERQAPVPDHAPLLEQLATLRRENAALWAENVALRVDMARMFAQLTPQQRQMMWLAYVEGADHREIASQMNLRAGSIRVLLHRARRRLARLLEQRPGDPRKE